MKGFFCRLEKKSGADNNSSIKRIDRIDDHRIIQEGLMKH